MIKYPSPPTGTGFVVVALIAVVAALGVIQVEMRGLAEHTRQLTGIRASGQPMAAARIGAQGADSASERGEAVQRAGGVMPVANANGGK